MRPTRAKPITIGGKVFTCWKTAIGQYVWRTEDNALVIYRQENRTTRIAVANGKVVGQRFRTDRAAMIAAIRAARAS